MENDKYIPMNSTSKLIAKRKSERKVLKLSANGIDLLEKIFNELGGAERSAIYWKNHEDEFRMQIEAKFLTRKAMQEAAEENNPAKSNVFFTFIQNNGMNK